MKKIFLFFFLVSWQINASAANLIEVYQQAQQSDPIFLQAVSQRLSTKQGVPISLSAILPNIQFTANPSITRQAFSGTNFSRVINASPGTLNPRNNTQRAYTMTLTATQTIFDFSQFSAIAGQVAISKGADATLNSALQDLMIRVAKAYFVILKDEENLHYSKSATLVYLKQLDEVKQQFKVGLKTQTDVYTAQASYDSARADDIAAQSKLANDKENLRVITGIYYSSLSKLSDDFPLVSPKPANIESWVKTALAQNWNIKASQYNVDTKRQLIRQQFSGHLPTLNLQGTLDRQYVNNINGYQNLDQRNGPGTQTDRALALNLTVPIFAGGGVVAQTNQATYDYQVAQQQLEQTVRDTVNLTRQSYYNILAGISKITADQQAIKSSKSSLAGMEESYKVGIETLVNVLNQQQKLYEAQIQYSEDRYNFINYILSLKQAAGTLSFNDLHAINNWLIDPSNSDRLRSVSKHSKKKPSYS